jgi:hypothetical protein
MHKGMNLPSESDVVGQGFTPLRKVGSNIFTHSKDILMYAPCFPIMSGANYADVYFLE